MHSLLSTARPVFKIKSTIRNMLSFNGFYFLRALSVLPIDTRCDGCHAQYMESRFRNTELEPGILAHRLNTAHDVQGLLRRCLDVPRWVEQLAGQRPFVDDDAVLSAVFTAAEPLTSGEIDAALHVHPRIGDRPERDDVHAALARHEQSGVDVADSEVSRRLREGNLAYERRFGRVFLIRAAGRDAAEILAALDERLGNVPESELRIVDHELREIAASRLVRSPSDD